MRTLLHLLLPLCCLVLAACGRKETLPAATASAKHKSSTWPSVTPAAAGFDQGQLEAFANAVGGNGVVIRHDALAFTWGVPSKSLDVASASKPMMVHMVFKAIEAGKIKSLDEPVLKWEPGLAQLNASLNHKDAAITWRHLVNQTSCYGVTEAPGTAFDYNDYQTALLWTLIYEKVNASKREAIADTVLRPQLFDLIEAEDKPSLRIQPEPKVNGRLVISPRDFARFGLVYLHGGKWKGKQVVDASAVGTALGSPLPLSLPRSKGKDAEMLPNQRSYGGGKNQEDNLGSYSFMWWLNRPDRDGKPLWPSIPADAFAAVGNGGVKVMMVIPSLDLVIAWNDANLKALAMCGGGRDQMDAVLKVLMDALQR